MGTGDSFESLVQRAISAVDSVVDQLTIYLDGLKPQVDEDINWRELRLVLNVTATKLWQWKSLWFPDTPQFEGFHLALWGESGEAELRKLLDAIVEQAKRSRPFIETTESDSDTPAKRQTPKQSKNWWRLSKHMRGLSKDRTGDSVQPQSNAFLTMQTNIKQLGKYVDELAERAELLFRTLHAAFPGSDAIESQLLNVAATRRVSNALYEYCSLQNRPLHLDLNLLNNDDEIDKMTDLMDWWRDLKVTYRFMITDVTTPSRVQYISLEPIEHSATATECRGDYGLAIMDVVQSQRESAVTIRSLPASDGVCGQSFYAKASTHSLDRGAPVEILPLIEQASWSSALLRWPSDTGDRVWSAYRVAEGGLFLLGTPWLSHVSFDTVCRTGSKSPRPQIYLNIQDFNVLSSHEFSQAKLEREQLVSIGTLLVEIALECRLGAKENGEVVIGVDKMTKVGEMMGHRYQQACEFCLGDRLDQLLDDSPVGPISSPFELDLNSEKVLRSYYYDVFIPIRDVWHSFS